MLHKIIYQLNVAKCLIKKPPASLRRTMSTWDVRPPQAAGAAAAVGVASASFMSWSFDTGHSYGN